MIFHEIDAETHQLTAFVLTPYGREHYPNYIKMRLEERPMIMEKKLGLLMCEFMELKVKLFETEPEFLGFDFE